MRRALIVCLVLAVPLAMATPVMAGKPNKPPKPSKGLEVSIEANLYAWNVEGDEILFDLMVKRPSLEEVVVTLVINGETMDLPSPEPDWSEWSSVFVYTVPYSSEPGTDPPTIVATLTANSVSDSVTVEAWPVGACPDVIASGGTEPEYAGGICYASFAPGYWTIVAEPEAPSDRFALTMRDHVPGNWCMVGEETRGKPTGAQTIEVFIPEDGVCLLGGRGVCTESDCYFAIGNPANFVLAAPAGTVTATYHGTSLPPPDES